MKPLRTALHVQPVDWHIDHQTRLLGMGSCFAEEIGRKLSRLKFPTCINPFGIVYNPHSLAQSLQYLLQERQFAEEDLFEYDGLWHSFDLHGSFSAPNSQTLLNAINASVAEAAVFLRFAKVLLLTLGTAHAFRLKTNGRIVANCHKLPGQRFERFRLSLNDVVDTLSAVLDNLFRQNPGIKVVLTVSPVRHLRDGLVENNLSKATLLLAADHLCKTFDNLHYFPAYELLIDDLRDYRFYAADLSHPNDLALDYIWEIFAQTFFSPATIQLCEEIDGLKRAIEHRPLHPESENYRQFRRQQAEKCRRLALRYPELDFSEELAFFEQD